MLPQKHTGDLFAAENLSQYPRPTKRLSGNQKLLGIFMDGTGHCIPHADQKGTPSIKYTVHALFSTSFAVGRPEVHFCPILDGV